MSVNPDATETTGLLRNRVSRQETGCMACIYSMVKDDEDKAVRVPPKMEPKVHLANERTFLHWLSVAVLIGMLALTLLRMDVDGVAYLVLGIAFLVCSIAFMVYALLAYIQRGNRIRDGQVVRFDDNRGPVVLAIVMMAAFLSTAAGQLGLGR
eukprot:TRINITY_DN3696_c0_g1_i1.p1 TRINITY_DN3696_c0_g1~~TRINITY_DN3696_c0_g1_i1.p1  ORF type:complete len:153 (+),score=22.78 TRINITY_DN3696_c0_g1_i1:57-515(+)